MGTLDAVEVRLLVRVHGWILDIVLLAGTANLEGQPHVENESPRCGKDYIAVVMENFSSRR